MITIAGLVLAADANGQIQPNSREIQSRRDLPSGANAGATPGWQYDTASSGEHISNAPRSISTAADAANEALPASPGRRKPLAASDDSENDHSMPLPPRTKRQREQSTVRSETSSGHALLTVLGSLAIVLAVFFAFVWLTRSAAPKGMAPLSKEVVESLGRAPLLGRQQMQLIRIGNKLILLSVTSTGADTLTEITDPEEVDRLAGLCRQGQAGSISETFRQVLAQATSEPATSSRAARRQARRSETLEPHRA